jgi:hypothetical protein
MGAAFTPTDSEALCGRPIVAAAGFQPALCSCAPVGFSRYRLHRQGRLPLV